VEQFLIRIRFGSRGETLAAYGFIKVSIKDRVIFVITGSYRDGHRVALQLLVTRTEMMYQRHQTMTRQNSALKLAEIAYKGATKLSH